MIFNCELTPTIRWPFSIQLHFKLILLEQLARFISTPVGCFETCKEKTKYQKKLFYCNALPGPPAHDPPPLRQLSLRGNERLKRQTRAPVNRLTSEKCVEISFY